MSEPMGGTTERPNLPKRLELIEDLVRSALETVSRIVPVEDDKAEQTPTPAGIEEAAARVERSLQILNTRLVAIAERVGQL